MTIGALYGAYARSAGKKAKTKQTTFDGQTFLMGSPEHHAVMRDAIRGKRSGPHGAEKTHGLSGLREAVQPGASLGGTHGFE